MQLAENSTSSFVLVLKNTDTACMSKSALIRPCYIPTTMQCEFQDFGGFFPIAWVSMCAGESPKCDRNVVCVTILSVARQPQLH